jgi:hypothetical protein
MANKKNVGRKQIDPDNILYKIDADHQRRILGPPGDPKSHVPKLLAKLRDLNIDSFGEIVQRVKAQFPNDYAKEGHKIDLKNPELIAALFEPATQIDGKNRAVDRSIVAAFEKSGLNIGNPTDWQLLMGMFCWAHFGEKGRPGKAIYWTEKRYCALLRDVHEATFMGPGQTHVAGTR